MIILELFLQFLKIGAFAFGGAYGAIPLIRETVLSMGWMNEAQLMNLLGIRMNRHYPDGRFWRIAAKEGCSVILGSDAHRPEDVDCPEAVQRAESILKKCGFSEGNGRSHGYSVTVSVDH